MSYFWNVVDRKDISGGAEVVHSVTAGSTSISIQADIDVQIRFDGTSTNNTVSANNDILVSSGVWTEVTVPVLPISRGFIYLHIKPTTSATTKYVKLVEH